MKTRHTIIPVALLAGGLLAGTFLVPEARSGLEETRETRQLSEKDVRQMVAGALPKWDSDVLSAPDGDRWSGKLGTAQVLRAVGDGGLKEQNTGGDGRVVDGDRVLRVTPQLGKVRYVHRGRRWDPARGEKLPDKQVALNIATKALAGLGLPRAELGKVRVDTQGGRDAANKSPEETRSFEMYRLVTVTRRVGQFPVLGSRARVAINAGSDIQRLRVSWPPFTMPDGLSLRSRETVANQVVERIMRQDPVPLQPVKGSDDKAMRFVRARLAYAPVEMTVPRSPRPAGEESEPQMTDTERDTDDKTPDGPVQFQAKRLAPVRYVPVVLVTVYADPTPYQLVVPVAGSK